MEAPDPGGMTCGMLTLAACGERLLQFPGSLGGVTEAPFAGSWLSLAQHPLSICFSCDSRILGFSCPSRGSCAILKGSESRPPALRVSVHILRQLVKALLGVRGLGRAAPPGPSPTPGSAAPRAWAAGYLSTAIVLDGAPPTLPSSSLDGSRSPHGTSKWLLASAGCGQGGRGTET